MQNGAEKRLEPVSYEAEWAYLPATTIWERNPNQLFMYLPPIVPAE